MRFKLVPPTLLVAIALLQIVLAHAAHLTAWKGGGFGMFSTLDHGAYRGVDVLIEAPDRSEMLEIPPSLETAAARAAAFPADWLMNQLAKGVVAREARYGRAATRITVTAWRADFDRATLRPSTRTIRTFVYVAPEP